MSQYKPNIKVLGTSPNRPCWAIKVLSTQCRKEENHPAQHRAAHEIPQHLGPYWLTDFDMVKWMKKVQRPWFNQANERADFQAISVDQRLNIQTKISINQNDLNQRHQINWSWLIVNENDEDQKPLVLWANKLR